MIDISDDDSVGLNLYVPCHVIKQEDDGSTMTIRLPKGNTYKVYRDKVTDARNEAMEGRDDILKLTEFSEMSLIHALRVRYARDSIYTTVGPILISINPYKKIDCLFDDSSISKYHGTQDKLSPHLFIIAEKAYNSLVQNALANRVADQSIIISGESGAGKTEATKVIMSFLARITAVDSRSQDKNGLVCGELEQQVLNTNPILEGRTFIWRNLVCQSNSIPY